MNDDIIKKIQEKSKKSGTKHIDNFFSKNLDVVNYCHQILKLQPWFQNIINVFIAVGHNIFDIVLCKNCKKPLKVKSAIYGKRFYCCAKCAFEDPNVVEKRKATCLEKYGTCTPLLNEQCKEKTIKTCIEKYDNVMFAGSSAYKERVSTPFLKKETHLKSKKTKIEKYGYDYGKIIFQKNRKDIQNRNINKYGVPYLLMNDDILQKTHQTMIQKYGCDNFFATEQIHKLKNKIFFKKLKYWGEYVIPLFQQKDYTGHQNNQIYKWKCTKCGKIFESRIYVTGIGQNRIIPRCENCFPNNASSIPEKHVISFIRDIYNGEIFNNIKCILRNRKLQLDIYLPQKKLAIEFDGNYWHSENVLNSRKTNAQKYHLNKTYLCLQKGIQLIHIFEDEWIYKQKIVKDRIKSILGIDRKRIYARKCEIREIDNDIKNMFLNQNHLQGQDNSKVKLGLYYQNQLISVMTFGKPRFNRNYQWQLIRFASKLGYQVIGGAGKLLSYFQKNYHPKNLISYADRRYSTGKMYYSLGFKFLNNSEPNYWWYKGNVKYSRYQCQKHKLKDILGQSFNQQLSETQNMYLNGFNKIYDCGNMVFIKQQGQYLNTNL